jgi:hypothetical protein
MLKLKEQYLNSQIRTGMTSIKLTNELTQVQLQNIYDVYGGMYFEPFLVLTDADAEADLNGEPRPDNNLFDPSEVRPKKKKKKK